MSPTCRRAVEIAEEVIRRAPKMDTRGSERASRYVGLAYERAHAVRRTAYEGHCSDDDARRAMIFVVARMSAAKRLIKRGRLR